MSGTSASKQRAPRRRWAPAEKRRIVELTLRTGASIGSIARENGVHPNNLRQWEALYRAGKLDAPVKPALRVSGSAAGAKFVPVNVVGPARRSQLPARPDESAFGSGVVEIVLATGATLRLETRALDAALVCALVAELQR